MPPPFFLVFNLFPRHGYPQSKLARLEVLFSLSSLRLMSRFSYVQLKYAIDALNATATRDRLRGLARRKRGYSNASHAIDIYLNAKRDASGEPLARDNLSEYRRVSTRWYQLISISPLPAVGLLRCSRDDHVCSSCALRVVDT